MSLFRFTIRMSVDDVIYKFNLNYRDLVGGDNPQSAQSAAEAWRAQCQILMPAFLSSSSRVESIYVRKADGPTIPAWRGNLNNQVGVVASDAVSAQNAMLVNLRNSAGLLKRSGRIFVSGLPETALLLGVINSGFITGAVTPWLNSLLVVGPGGTPPWQGQLVVVRNQIDGVPQTPPVLVDVDGIDVTTTFGTIQKRKGQLIGFRT